ncbi:MAG: hypothetical protein JWN14_2987 [Chthonomonadales bacterium]|nr:hypothetical protein [Chthonomonadales bacterium]
MPSKNRYLEAFKESHNAIGLAAVVALCAATLNPIPLIAGLVLEAAYLLIVPDSKWYAARLAKKFDGEIEERRRKLKEQTLPTLRPELQQRFTRLETLRQQIGERAAEDERWFREVLRKLDFLLDKFLQFASKEAQFYSYLHGLLTEVRSNAHKNTAPYDLDPPRKDRDHRASRSSQSSQFRPSGLDAMRVEDIVAEIQTSYDKAMEEVREGLEQEQDYDTKAILQKRLDVLQRRHEFAGKTGKILKNLDHQLQLVEDTFGLINDEIRARSPEQLLSDIEEVVVASNSMTSALEELAPFEHIAARMGQE